MNQVQPHPLWLGHAGDGRDFRQIFESGIEALVQLAAEEPTPPVPRELIFCRFPLVDGAGNSHHLLLLTLGSVTHLLKMHLPTLLCCSAGMSRSPAIAAGALAILNQDDPEKSLETVLKNYPADVSPAFWSAVKSTCQQLIGLAKNR